MHRRMIATVCSMILILSCSQIPYVEHTEAEETELATETEIETELYEERIECSELPAEPETGLESEYETESETDKGMFATEMECETHVPEEKETEIGSELETEYVSEIDLEEETEFMSEPDLNEEMEAETESSSEEGPESETECFGETEIFSDTEVETETMTEAVIVEMEAETELPNETKPGEMADQERLVSVTYADNSFWDASWYVETDFRFKQVKKEYVLIKNSEEVYVHEAKDDESAIVGKIPYFGLAFLLEENGDWSYIESGAVRGFVKTADISERGYAEEIVAVIGEESFEMAVMTCGISQNAAFTYTHTTVYEVLAEKQYALLLQSEAIHEYPDESSRPIGKAVSGSLVYVLEDAGDKWSFVESGDVRGFVKNECLLNGVSAERFVQVCGEEAVELAEEYVSPKENRSCYYTLKSVKAASADIGEAIAEYAISLVGKLPYVWGGTSLTTGADCSGFIQSVYAAFGIKIPRLAQEQGMSGEKIENLESARPGDVVYWAVGPHIGIYIGNGKVVQCSGTSHNTSANPGRGPVISDAAYQPITSIRRFVIEKEPSVTKGAYCVDGTDYTQKQMELIWAIVAQEDNGSYEGALAVISSAMNRTESPSWSYCGSNALMQLMAPGQYCYSMDSYWQPRLGGNVPEYVKQAVNDCLKKGIRNHTYTCFRSRKGSQTGADAVKIGGNWFFGT